MAHEITQRDDGTSEAAYALTPAWHGLGAVLDHPMSSAEALEAAQLDWKVAQWPMAIGKPKSVKTPEGEVKGHDWEVQESLLANVREDTGLFLGVVSDHYQVVQNTEAFSFLDDLVKDHQMEYESAFSLRGGKSVVLLGRLPKVDEIVPGDKIKRYILLSLGHDGTGAIRFGPCATRVVCANTHAVALREGSVKDLTIRHMGNIQDKLDRARTILDMAGEKFDDYAEIGKQLASRRFTRSEWYRFLDVMCPKISPDDPDFSTRRANALADTRHALSEQYRGERQVMPGVENTAWAAYNAVTEHIDHLPRRGATSLRKAEARFNTVLYGPGRDMKQRAWEAACRIAGIELAMAG